MQTQDYIKILVETYITRVCGKHPSTWMDMSQCTASMTPLPNKSTFRKAFLSSIGNPDEKHQKELAERTGFGYRNGIGEILYAMITAWPDLAYVIVRAAQHSVCPHKNHYNGVRHLLKHLCQTRTHGICYWRTKPNMFLSAVEHPQIDSKFHDLLLDRRPLHEPLELYAQMDADWATCPITRISIGGGAMHLARGVVAYKINLMQTVA